MSVGLPAEIHPAKDPGRILHAAGPVSTQDSHREVCAWLILGHSEGYGAFYNVVHAFFAPFYNAFSRTVTHLTLNFNEGLIRCDEGLMWCDRGLKWCDEGQIWSDECLI